MFVCVCLCVCICVCLYVCVQSSIIIVMEVLFAIHTLYLHSTVAMYVTYIQSLSVVKTQHWYTCIIIKKRLFMIVCLNRKFTLPPNEYAVVPSEKGNP